MRKEIHRVTREGLAQMKKSLEELHQKLSTIDRQVVETYSETSDEEDIEYASLASEKLCLQREIERFEEDVKNSRVIRTQNHSSAQPGSTLKLENHRICHIFRLVEQIEANPLKGRISIQSPLGLSVLGKRVGEEILLATPLGRNSFKIVSIG